VVSGALPDGLGMTINGLISGTPTVPGNFHFTIKATSGDGGFVTKPFTLSVLEISTTTITGYTIGTPYSFQMLAAGGSGMYQWSISSGALPAGLTISDSGLISGTPTADGTNPVEFRLIDLACEAAVQTVYPPQVSMTSKSTTQIATVRGWSEFPGFESSPPKKFKTVSWSGSSEQQLWLSGVQIGGAKLDWIGIDQIDSAGNITDKHQKLVSLMCDGDNNRSVIIGDTPNSAVIPSSPSNGYAAFFLGYDGTASVSVPNLVGPTQLCPTPNSPYLSVGDAAITSPFNSPQMDLYGLWGSDNYTGIRDFIGTALISFDSNTTASSSDSGTDSVEMSPYVPTLINPSAGTTIPNVTMPGGLQTVIGTVGAFLQQFSFIQTASGRVPRPADWTVTAQVIFTNSYSAMLLNEYTDAEALTNARVITGNGSVAQNFPRTTGFVSTFTNVVFTLNAINLVENQNYLVSVDFFDLTSGTNTTKQYGFVGDATTKHTITDVIPTPVAGHSVQVRNPRIAFSP
jgi:hypothetical protein